MKKLTVVSTIVSMIVVAVSAIASRRKAVVVLALGLQAEDRATLYRIFRPAKWKLYEAATCRSGLALLRQHGIGVVICETELPDGTWKTVLEGLRDLSTHPRLIVSSRLADVQLWGEVLNLGGYDLLATPFEPGDVRSVVALAWHSSEDDAQPTTRVHRLTGNLHTAAAHA